MDYCSLVTNMSEPKETKQEKKKDPAGYTGRRSLPPNVSNADEDEVPIMETFGVIPRGVNMKGKNKSIFSSFSFL